MSPICSMCGENYENGDIHKWHLFEVLDYKQKIKKFIGLPSGGTTTLEGWKIKNHDSISTSICEKCINSAVGDKLRLHKAKFRKLALYSGSLAIICTLVALKFELFYLLAFLFGFVCLIYWGESKVASLKTQLEKAHGNALEKAVGRPVIDLETIGKPPVSKGALFHVRPEKLEKVSALYNDTQQKTGWSYVYMVTKTQFNTSVYDPLAGTLSAVKAASSLEED